MKTDTRQLEKQLRAQGSHALADSFQAQRTRERMLDHEDFKRQDLARRRLESSRRRGTVDDISAHQDITGSLNDAVRR